LSEAVADIPLAEKIVSQLGNQEIFYLYQLVEKSEADLLQIKNIGAKTITAINEALAFVGLKLKEE
jgi:DNA-directed RNA polymerase subunit alpha